MRLPLLTLSLSLSAMALTLTSCQSSQPQPKQAKYVFYFITDGTGVNTVLGTEQMLAEIQGRWGRDTLCMTSFPVVGVSSTYSDNSGITDSAASGTALASGTKTYNGAIGMDRDTVPCYGVAAWAHEAGVPVGIATSVSVNHATPAAQYAHVVNRNFYYQIACQLPTTDFDFFGGSDFHFERQYSSREYRDSVYQACQDSGYVIARGYDDYVAKAAEADKMILIQSLDRSLNVDDGSLPYAIDAKPGELSVYDITKAQIDFLYKKSEAKGGVGFFLMSEIGGKVDYACHAQDGATAFREVQLVDSCMRLAYEFYLQHPDETLILLTADHETGGLTLGCQSGGYVANFGLLQYQTCSVDAITGHFHALRSETKNHVSWEQVQEVLRQDLGFWGAVELTANEESLLKDIYARSFVGKMPNETNLYSENEPMAAVAVHMINDKAHLGWNTGGHTAGLVPVYACGVGAEQFCTHNDNTDFALKIARIAGYKK